MPILTNHLIFLHPLWCMDTWLLLEVWGNGGLLRGCTSTVQSEKNFCTWDAVFICQDQLPSGRFLFSLHLQVNFFPQTVWSAALKGQNCSTSWQLSLVTEGETTVFFRGCQNGPTLFQCCGSRLIEMWAATDISVCARLTLISLCVSICNYLFRWMTSTQPCWQKLLCKGPNHPSSNTWKLCWAVAANFPPHEVAKCAVQICLKSICKGHYSKPHWVECLWGSYIQTQSMKLRKSATCPNVLTLPNRVEPPEIETTCNPWHEAVKPLHHIK